MKPSHACGVTGNYSKIGYGAILYAQLYKLSVIPFNVRRTCHWRPAFADIQLLHNDKLCHTVTRLYVLLSGRRLIIPFCNSLQTKTPRVLSLGIFAVI